MNRIKSAIPRSIESSIVALKETMMQLMVKVGGINDGCIFDKQLLKPGVEEGRTQTPTV